VCDTTRASHPGHAEEDVVAAVAVIEGEEEAVLGAGMNRSWCGAV
jgi:hypothetical protein